MRDVHVSVELLVHIFCLSGGGRRRRAERGAQNAGLFKDSSVSVGLIRHGCSQSSDRPVNKHSSYYRKPPGSVLRSASVLLPTGFVLMIVLFKLPARVFGR